VIEREVSRIDGVEAAKEEVQIVTTTSNSSSNDLSPTTTSITSTDPWMLFLYALKAPATKEKYIQRLTKFLDFLGYQGTKEEKARAFADRARKDPVYAFNSILRFFQSKREQIDRKEMAIGTVTNYVKSVKLFCDMADVQIPWAKITRGLPRAKRFADDRAPTLQEILRIAEYPDRRIKPVIFTMASTGIRVGAWDYLKHGHIIPIEREGKVVAAKVLVYSLNGIARKTARLVNLVCQDACSYSWICIHCLSGFFQICREDANTCNIICVSDRANYA
jgi:hypothetical protein